MILKSARASCRLRGCSMVAGKVQCAGHIQQKRGWTVSPHERPVSIRFRRVHPLLEAGGDPMRAGMYEERPALSCDQPLIITRPSGCVNSFRSCRLAPFRPGTTWNGTCFRTESRTDWQISVDRPKAQSGHGPVGPGRSGEQAASAATVTMVHATSSARALAVRGTRPATETEESRHPRRCLLPPISERQCLIREHRRREPLPLSITV